MTLGVSPFVGVSAMHGFKMLLLRVSAWVGWTRSPNGNDAVSAKRTAAFDVKRLSRIATRNRAVGGLRSFEADATNERK